MKIIDILFVEDNQGDILLIKEAFKELGIVANMRISKTGEEALLEVQKTTPDLILLDLNLPDISGIKILNKIKRDKMLKHIPVIILTTSSSNADINAAFDFGANSYLTKPIKFEEFLECVKAFGDFWITFAKYSKK